MPNEGLPGAGDRTEGGTDTAGSSRRRTVRRPVLHEGRPRRGAPCGYGTVEREPTLPDKVTRLLLDRVMNGTLTSGTKLPSERELADQLGVSRTVVREAVRTLQAKGVLDVRSGASPSSTRRWSVSR